MFKPMTVCAVVLLLASCVTTGENTPADVYRTPVASEADIRARLDKASMPRQLKDLIIRLHHADPVERAWAAYQLAKLRRGAAPAVPYLVSLLEDETPVLLTRYVGGGFHSSSDTTPADEAVRTLGQIGEPATTSLILALKHPRPGVRARAAKALGHIGDINAIEFLLATLHDNERKVRASAALALGNYRNPRAAQMIMDAWTQQSDPAVQADMVYALAQINDIMAAPFLIDKSQAADVNLRAAIVFALGKLGDARAVPALITSLADTDEIVRANSAYALSKYYNPQVIDALIARLSDPVEQVRMAAQESLGILTGMQLGRDQAAWQQWWAATVATMQSDTH